MNRAETVFQNPAFDENQVGKVNNFTGADLTTNTYYFRPGQAMSFPSTNAGDQVYVFLSGTGQFYLNNGQEEVISVAPGSIVFVPVGVAYRMVNSGDGEMICTEISHPAAKP